MPNLTPYSNGSGQPKPRKSYIYPSKLGRPSRFNPSYCKEVIEFCADGFSLTAFAGHIGESRNTIADWMDDHEDFARACERAKAVAGKWWEAQANRAVSERGHSGGQTALIIFMLKNHAPTDFRERIEVSGKDGGALSLELILGKVAEGVSKADEPKTIEGEAVPAEGEGPD